MSGSTQRPRSALLAFVAAAAALPRTEPAFAQDGFHVTYGTTGSARHRNADGAGFVVETPSGDLVVAGSGAGYFTDTGETAFNPLVARFDRRGELRWQRVYEELENQRVIAVAARAEEQFLLLERFEWNDPASTLTLLRIDARGEPSGALATLTAQTIVAAIPVAGADTGHFLIAGSRIIQEPITSAPSAQLQLLRLDLLGRVTRSDLAMPGNAQVKHVGGDEILLSGWDTAARNTTSEANPHGIRATIVRMTLSGETQTLFTIDDALCNRLVASRDRIVCVQSPPQGVDDENRAAIVAYTRAGQELWRRTLGRRESVEQLRLLVSGELIYSIREAANESPVVQRVSTSGDVTWSHTLRSTGPYTLIAQIEPLANGRLALLGSTGEWNAFTSQDTDAMLFVTRIPDSDAPQIVSHIVDAP